MTTSEKQGDCCRGSQDAQTHDERNTHARSNESSRIVVSTFPLAANDGCCTTRFARDEVTGTNSPRQIGALGQMLTLVTRREEGGVSTGCGCGPNGNTASTEEHGETPLRVDAGDRPPFHVVGGDDVANRQPLVADIQSRSPEGGVESRTEKTNHNDQSNRVLPLKRDEGCCAGNGCRCRGERGENTARSGDESHVLHVSMEVSP